MKSPFFLKWLIIPALMLFTYIPAASADFDAESWAYSRSIIYPSQIETMGVKVQLDNDLLTQVLEDFRDVRVVNSKGNEIPYAIVGDVQTDLAKIATVDMVEINGQEVLDHGYDFSNIKDDNKKSFVAFDKEAAVVSLTYKMEVPSIVNKVNSFTYDPFNTWTEIEVEASHDKKDWTILRSKTEVEHATWRWLGFPRYSTPYEYYRVTLWAKGQIQLHELALLTENTASLVFQSEPSERYSVYYGNMRAATPEYTMPPIEQTVTATLSQQQKNVAWNRDEDADDVDYVTDNCPYIPNPGQEDVDGDGIGDACEVQADEVKEPEIRTIATEKPVEAEVVDTNKNVERSKAEDKTKAVVVKENRMSEFILYTIAFFIIGIIVGVWVGGDRRKKKK